MQGPSTQTAITVETFEMKHAKGSINMGRLKDLLCDKRVNQLPLYLPLFFFCQEISRVKGQIPTVDVDVVARAPENGIPELYKCEYLLHGRINEIVIPASFVVLKGETSVYKFSMSTVGHKSGTVAKAVHS